MWGVSIPMAGRPRDEIMGILAALVPVVIMLLVQRPDVRKAIAMRSSLCVKRFADSQEHMWATIASKAAMTYQNARL